MTVYMDAGPVISSITAIGVASVGGLLAHSRRRENRQKAMLENVRTDIKGDVSKWVDAVLALTASVSDVRESVAFLRGVREGELKESR